MICQFEITDDGEIVFHFVSKGISSLHPRLNPETVKANPEILFGVIHEDDVRALRKALSESFSTLSEGSVEFRIVNVDGQIEWHAARWKAEKIDSGDVVWYGFFININNHVEYERAMEQIAFDISHVLRRPVTTLLGLTSVIEKEDLTPDKVKEYTRYIKVVSSGLEEFTRKLNHTYSLKSKIITGGK